MAAWVSMAVTLASAAAFLIVGTRLAAREVPEPHRPAARAFGVAWIAAGTHSLVLACAAAGLIEGIVAAWSALVLGTAVLAGVVSYLAYLLTGSRLAVPIVVAAYLALLAASAAIVTAFGPAGAEVTAAGARFRFAGAPPAANGWIALALLAPAVLASIAYLAMFPLVPTATARWRVALVGGGLLLWSSAAILARIGGTMDGLPFVRATGAALAAAVLVAYMPPAWVRRRWGIERIDGELPAEPANPALRAASEEALGRRVRELV